MIHGLGIVHRDVKPQNLLLASTRDGGTKVLVADLGVAKALLHATGITQVVGTPAYMAPEQVHMETSLDQRADVHALGAVAYHLLSGRPARTGDMVTLDAGGAAAAAERGGRAAGGVRRRAAACGAPRPR